MAGPERKKCTDWSQVVEGGGTVFLASLVGNGLNYGFAIVLARWLGAADFGVYALGLTIFNVLTLVLVLGLDTGIVKFVSHHLATGQGDRARHAIAHATTVAGVCGLVGGIVLACLAPTISNAVYGKPDLLPVLLWFSIAIPLATVSAVWLSSLQAFQTVRYTVLVKYLWEPVGKFLLAGLLVAAGFGLGGALFGIVVTLAISAGYFMRGIRCVAFGDTRHRTVWSRHEVQALMAFSGPLTISNAVAVFASRSDILVLGYWVSAQEVGIYLAAFQTAAVMSLVLGSFESVYAPALGRSVAEQEWSNVEQLYRAMSRMTGIIATPIFLFLIITSKEVLGWFGDPFIVGAACLTVLAVGQLLNNLIGSASAVLLMAGHSRLVMVNTVLLGLLMIGATVLLIPAWGIWGGALAAAASLVLMNVTRVLEVWWLHGIHPFTWSLCKPIFAGLAAAGLMLGVRAGLGLPAFSVLLPMGILAYVGCLVAMGLETEDVAGFNRILKRIPGVTSMWALGRRASL